MLKPVTVLVVACFALGGVTAGHAGEEPLPQGEGGVWLDDADLLGWKRLIE